jgi:hypothetical protein
MLIIVIDRHVITLIMGVLASALSAKLNLLLQSIKRSLSNKHNNLIKRTTVEHKSKQYVL